MNSDFIRFFPIFRLFPTFRLLDLTGLDGMVWYGNLWMHLFYDANNDKSQLQGVKRYLQNSPDKPWPVKAFKGQIVSLTFSF